MLATMFGDLITYKRQEFQFDCENWRGGLPSSGEKGTCQHDILSFVMFFIFYFDLHD